MTLLLALFLLQAGPPQPVGTVSGLVRGADGKPVQGMRVFAVALRDAAEAVTGATVFEGLAQTDASGRYSLEIPPGRYFIACGSVAVPTYYPGTTNVGEARPVTLASGVQVNGVDFAGFVAPPAPRPAGAYVVAGALFGATFGSLNSPPPSSFATVVSGTIRLREGTPAKGMEVIAIQVPRSANAEVSSRSIPFRSVARARSDDFGRYRLVNVAPGDYYLLSGTKDAPSFYPGVSDLARAVPVSITLSQPVDNRDFTVSGVALSGRVTAAGGVPAIGVRIRVRTYTLSSDTAGPASLMSSVLTWETTVDGADGSYSVGGLSPGGYLVEPTVTGLQQQSKGVTVGSQDVKGIDFSLPIAMVSGRILLEDGSPVPDARVLGNAVISTANNPNLILSSVFRVSSTGTFGDVLEPGEYQVELPSLPQYHSIKSIASGTHDLLKESLKVTASESVVIEIRLAK